MLQAKKIQEAGTKRARELVTPAQVLCYHVMFFKVYLLCFQAIDSLS